MKEYMKQMSHNRSTLYHYFKDCDMQMRMTKIGKGVYKVFIPANEWEDVYLTVNSVRFTNFQSLILFTNELVVRYSIYGSNQVNIPYKIIDTIQIDNDLDIGYEEIHLNKWQVAH